MNNFDGALNLYPEICIDNFSSSVLFSRKIRCFILTHFHDDHMKNLEDHRFYTILKQNMDIVKFYCSPVTKDFISICNKYNHLTDVCHEISIDTPFIVHISNKETVTVSFSGSGHCPGSIMVFIEGSRGNVLFTGDFRLPANTVSCLSVFKGTFDNADKKQLKSVDNLYIDMTFFKNKVPYIPSREESSKALIDFLKSFLNFDIKTDFTKLVYLKTSARIGYEYIYQEINRVTGYKIHVNDLIYKLYEKLPQIQNILTSDPYETPIHCCIYENRKRDLAKTDLMTSGLNSKAEKASYENLSKKVDSSKPIIPCVLDYDDEKSFKKPLKVNAVKVILSAMWFTDNPGINKIMVEYRPNQKELESPAYKPYKSIYRLCFSFHSSLEEIIDFVNTLKPKKMYCIALPESTTENTVNKYFYDSNQNFVGFHKNNENKTNFKHEDSSTRNALIKKSNNLKNKILVIKKRKSFEIFESKNSQHDSSNESSDDNNASTDNDSLKFDDSDNDEISFNKKKIKS
ncbi:unnamed protein product [Brachionus calyciflorus]|uniref:Protein artemis n=1 Tax=Brachionus calyciflorus TaxID=104777 RepID=A0A814F5B0_9BILA|nr:unnamed protein product [Brachionus calyciflorus]